MVNTKKLELLLLSFVILFSFFIFTNVKYRHGDFFAKLNYSSGVEDGYSMGQQSTLKYLHINGYLPDTLIIDTFLLNDIKKYDDFSSN